MDHWVKSSACFQEISHCVLYDPKKVLTVKYNHNDCHQELGFYDIVSNRYERICIVNQNEDSYVRMMCYDKDRNRVYFSIVDEDESTEHLRMYGIDTQKSMVDNKEFIDT